jgi:hypothetical protein
MLRTRKIAVLVAALLCGASGRADDPSQSDVTGIRTRSSRIVSENILGQLREGGTFMFPSGVILRAGRVETDGTLGHIRFEWTDRDGRYACMATRGKIVKGRNTCLLGLENGHVIGSDCEVFFGGRVLLLAGPPFER